MLDYLDQQHPVGRRELACMLGRELRELDVAAQVLVEPVDRIDTDQPRGAPPISHLAKQLAAPAAHVDPAQGRLRIGGR